MADGIGVGELLGDVIVAGVAMKMINSGNNRNNNSSNNNSNSSSRKSKKKINHNFVKSPTFNGSKYSPF